MRGKKRRPSPEISRVLRRERGRRGWAVVWRWRETAVSILIRRPRIDDRRGGGGFDSIGEFVSSLTVGNRCEFVCNELQTRKKI